MTDDIDEIYLKWTKLWGGNIEGQPNHEFKSFSDILSPFERFSSLRRHNQPGLQKFNILVHKDKKSTDKIVQ